jgi:preprotein translocase subunit SecD
VSSRRGLSAVLLIVVAVAGAVYTVVAGNQPLLGLDLQGGVSVVLQPTREPDEEALLQTVEIIRSRVDALGVAEPEISTQGDTIVVDLPGVKEQQRALDLVGQTAELRFRPVIFDLGPALIDDADLVDTDDPGTTTTPSDDDGSDTSTTTAATDEDGSDASTTTTTAADNSDESSTTAGNEESAGVPAGRTAAALVQQGTTSTTADEGSTTTTDGDDGSTTTAPAQGTVDPRQLAIIEACTIAGVTAPEDDLADQPVVLASEDGNRLCLGPTLLTGDSLETAGVSLDPLGNWTVSPTFKSGSEGIDAFNQAAALCYIGAPDPNVCPSARLAIVLDHVVVSSPQIQAQAFSRDGIVISGDFGEEEARDLAAVLRFGALPVELEAQQTRTVSASIGDDVLRAGVIAGLIGLALVAIFLLAYYRLAGLVAIGGLVISALLLWTIVAWFGENLGLALTLAGVVGLIVSIGVSADSNIVYFENVKDAYRGGRTITTSVERAYRSAISTIIKADVVSLIAAALLYWLTVGAVRGFAFYLGLATILDLVVSWFFMRPALAFLARRKAVTDRPGWLGLPAGAQS